MAEIIEYGNLEGGYRALLAALLKHGDDAAPRGQETFELQNVVLEHGSRDDVLLYGVRPRFSEQLAALESLQLVGGFSDPDLLVRVVPHYAEFLDGGKFHGAYGDRTGLKFALIADRLAADPDSRRANVQFWSDEKDLSAEGLHDYPCTMHMNFLMRTGALNLTTVMRSNDAWLGFPYDLVQFTSLHRTMARFLGIEVGHYTHIAHSMHLYQRDVEKAAALLEDGFHFTRRTPLLTGGIGLGTETEWFQVQERAKQICYTPQTISPGSREEIWLLQQSAKWNA